MGEHPTQEEEGDLKNVTHRSRKIKKHPDPLLPNNWFQGVPIDFDSGPLEQRILSQPPRSLKEISQTTAAERTWASGPNYRKRCVLIIGDFLLRSVEAKVCQLDFFLSQEAYGLPGAHSQDVTERMKRYIKPADYYPFLAHPYGSKLYCPAQPKMS